MLGGKGFGEREHETQVRKHFLYVSERQKIQDAKYRALFYGLELQYTIKTIREFLLTTMICHEGEVKVNYNPEKQFDRPSKR